MNLREDFAALDKQLHDKCKQANIPGMALVVAKEGKPIFEKYYGYRDVEKKLEVTKDTVFGVASITKSFATLAIMQLADQGKLNVQDAVTKWLPEFKLPETSYNDQVTIHHLMTHTSGLPGLPAVHQARAHSIKNDPDGEYLFGDIPNLTESRVKTVDDLLQLLGTLDYSLLGPPGHAFNYSNECFALLQAIIERASGKTFLEYMDTYILQPLNMTHSTFLTDELKDMVRVTELYALTQDDKKEVFHSPEWWDVGDIYSNGSLKASVMDLINYLEVYRLNGTVNGQTIASEESVKQMMMPQAIAPNDNKYGYGLQIHDRFGQRLVGHGGGIKGVSSNMLICQEHDLTVAVLTNIAKVDAEGLAMTAIKYVLGREEEAVKESHYEMAKDDLERYVGLYKSLEGNSFDVRIEDKKLKLDVDHNTLVIDPIEKDVFRTQDGKKIVFMTNDGDDVIGIFSGLRHIPKIS